MSGIESSRRPRGVANAIAWRSRRGMLELDHFLYPFALQRYPELPMPMQELYEELLDFEDVQLLEWLLSPVSAPPRYRTIVKKIKMS